MNYYFLPGTGVSGDVKVGYQFADLLNGLEARCVVVTPDGRAPDWFKTSAPTLSEAAALPRLTGAEALLFSLPHDHPRLSALPGRLVFHCQTAGPLSDAVIADSRVTLLTCWPQAAAHVRERAGRASVEVGISVADAFRYRGRPKIPGTVAFMPRRDADLAESCRAGNPGLRFVPIAGASESQTADLLLTCEFFLATAVSAWFGLPALEAMSAGCVVVSVPTVGGGAYLHDGVNCRVADPPDLPDTLAALAAPGARADRARLRDHALATASAYRPCRQRSTVARCLDSGLAFLRQ